MVLVPRLKLLMCRTDACSASDRSRDALPKLNMDETDAPLIHAALADMSENAARSACFEIKAHKGNMRRWWVAHSRLVGSGLQISTVIVDKGGVAGQLQLASSALQRTRGLPNRPRPRPRPGGVHTRD